MSDLVKGVMGGAWSLIVGWMLPVFLVVEVASWWAAPHLPDRWVESFLSRETAQRQLILLFIAAVTGLVLAALQTPLYRVLEGYLLWPREWRERRKSAHRALRVMWFDAANGLQPAPTLWWRLRHRSEKSRESAADATRPRDALEDSLVWTRVRYPAQEEQVAPTALGNAIRRFETYGQDRYQLDSQRLHHHLAANVPESVRQAEDRARTNVDFAVCLVWVSAAATILAVGVFAFIQTDAALFWFSAVSAGTAVMAYRLAVVATDEWAGTIRAQVDLGRAGAAKAFGLVVPNDLESERLMWSFVNAFLRGPYADLGDRPSWITYYRTVSPDEPFPSAALPVQPESAAALGTAQADTGETGDGHATAKSDAIPSGVPLSEAPGCDSDESAARREIAGQDAVLTAPEPILEEQPETAPNGQRPANQPLGRP